MTNNQLSCFICGYSWKSKHKEHDPKVCPACGNANWKTPSLAVSFLAAWRAFQNPFLVRKTTRRIPNGTIPTTTTPNDCICTTKTNPGCCPAEPVTTPDVVVKDTDGMSYAARLI
jgi:hypothetical protein